MLGGFPPGKSGWLLKRGHFIRNMKKRWFKLVEGQIKYYDDNSCKAEKGSIKLKGDFLYTNLRVTDSSIYGFQIVSPKGYFVSSHSKIGELDIYLSGDTTGGESK